MLTLILPICSALIHSYCVPELLCAVLVLMLQSAKASLLTLFARASTATCTLLWMIFGGDLSNVILGNMCNVSVLRYRVMLTNEALVYYKQSYSDL
jgi:hypothetical protein